WITPEAPAPFELAQCVGCGLCLAVCPTYRLTADETASPRGRLAAMAAVADGTVAIDSIFDDVIGFCLQCRACQVVCPALVPFGRMIEGVRAEIKVQKPSLARRARSRVLGRWVAMPGLVRLGIGAAALVRRAGLGRWMPRLLAGLRPSARVELRGREFAAVGPERGTAALLLGCVMESGFPQIHVATIETLQRAGYRVVTSAGQACCGALAAHEGAALDARRLAQRNVDVFSGADFVIADAAGCSSHLKEYGHWAGEGGADLASRVRDVTEIVAEAIEAGWLPVSNTDRGPVAVQDPCHLRHAQRIVDEPRIILRAAGYRIVEIDEDGLCCGAAGAWGLLHPEASDTLAEAKASQVHQAGSTIVASANVGCEMQLRAHLEGWYRVAHPVELYWEAVVDDATGTVG
ncbi:MAG TPA: (Fe-S)-binding protein, partial [Actinobacteria bacterium]|nr:(Fe-S)-binding protein [Actinomycetota bacterium]